MCSLLWPFYWRQSCPARRDTAQRSHPNPALPPIRLAGSRLPLTRRGGVLAPQGRPATKESMNHAWLNALETEPHHSGTKPHLAATARARPESSLLSSSCSPSLPSSPPIRVPALPDFLSQHMFRMSA